MFHFFLKTLCRGYVIWGVRSIYASLGKEVRIPINPFLKVVPYKRVNVLLIEVDVFVSVMPHWC